MHRTDSPRRSRSTVVAPPIAPFAASAEDAGANAPDFEPYGPATLSLAGPALLVEARFRELTLVSRLLHDDAPVGFTIGAARGADAPANPAYLGGADAHRLVEPAPGGFRLHLGPAMRAELHTPVQRLALTPDAGRAEAPLMLPPGSCLRLDCGEMTFELTAAEPATAMPRPWFPAAWREDWKYLAGAGLALLLLIGLAHLVPDDPRALSLDDIGVSHRMTPVTIMPPVLPPPPPQPATKTGQDGGGGKPAAARPAGTAGSKKAPDIHARMGIKGTADPRDERAAAAAKVLANPMLAMLSGPRSGSVAEVMDDRPAIGADATDAMGHLVGTTIADAYGKGGLSQTGTGAGGGGTHEGTIGIGVMGTVGRFGSGPGTGPGYGTTAGRLGSRRTKVPDVIPANAIVRGALDKEIIRRIVRRHLNEVRFCYEQSLAAHPTLSGRAVVQFTIAPTGKVLASVLQSSTLGVTAVDACVVSAVKRWEFPAPERGGLVMVSYPFQFAPAGN